MAQHAILAPSGAETWMTCAGSAAMQKGLPDTSNEYSDEGTAAHLLGSTCLEFATHPSAYLGQTILVGANEAAGFDGAVWGTEHDGGPEFKARRTYVVDDEMAEQVAKYVDRVRQYAGTEGVLTAERRVSISRFTGEEGAAGTADASIVIPRELQVHDLKYGMGVRVSAVKNKQLMTYALGVRDEMDMAYGPFDRIRLVIHQPRLDHLSEWDCTSEELDAFAEEVREKAAGALKLYREPMPAVIGDNCLALSPSEDACRWCKAKPTCPALAKFVMEASSCDFTAVPMLYEAGPKPVSGHTPEELAQKLAAVPLIEDWCKAIRAKVESELFAGVAIPGWKIVQGKRGNRSWTDEAAADALLKKMRLPVEERCNLKLKSPTQIEKLLKVEPKRLKRLLDAALIGQREGLPSVAPESDPRPVWVAPDSSADFSAVTTEELA